MNNQHRNRNTNSGKYTYTNLDLMCKCGHKLGTHTGEYPHDCCYGEKPEEYKQTCNCDGFIKNKK